MATSSQDTNIANIAAPASATPTNIGHVLGLNAAKTQDVLVPLSMLRQVIAQELKTALSAITGGTPDVPVLDSNNLKYMTLANFAKVVGGLPYVNTLTESYSESDTYTQGAYYIYSGFANSIGLGQNEGLLITLKPVNRTDGKERLMLQIFLKYDGSIFKKRVFNWSTQVWTSWTDI